MSVLHSDTHVSSSQNLFILTLARLPFRRVIYHSSLSKDRMLYHSRVISFIRQSTSIWKTEARVIGGSGSACGLYVTLLLQLFLCLYSFCRWREFGLLLLLVCIRSDTIECHDRSEPDTVWHTVKYVVTGQHWMISAQYLIPSKLTFLLCWIKVCHSPPNICRVQISTCLLLITYVKQQLRVITCGRYVLAVLFPKLLLNKNI